MADPGDRTAWLRHPDVVVPVIEVFLRPGAPS